MRRSPNLFSDDELKRAYPCHRSINSWNRVGQSPFRHRSVRGRNKQPVSEEPVAPQAEFPLKGSYDDRRQGCDLSGVCGQPQTADTPSARRTKGQISPCRPAWACGVTRTPERTVQHLSRIAAIRATQPPARSTHPRRSSMSSPNPGGYDVRAGEMGENITTSGIDLLGLPTGARLSNRALGRGPGHGPSEVPVSSWTTLQRAHGCGARPSDADGNLVRPRRGDGHCARKWRGHAGPIRLTLYSRRCRTIPFSLSEPSSPVEGG